MNDAPPYSDQYENFAISRSPSGVLTVRFHTDGKNTPLPAPPTTTSRGSSRTSHMTATTKCSC